MDDLRDTKAQRYRFLEYVYDTTEADERRSVSLRRIVAVLGLSAEQARKIAQYLRGANLIDTIETITIEGWSVSITHQGIVEVERIRSDPERPTELCPFLSRTSGANRNYLAAQQGILSYEHRQAAPARSDLERLKATLADLRMQLASAQLTADERAEAAADMVTIEAQLSSPNPKVEIIRAAIRSLLRLTEAIDITTGTPLA